MEFTQNTQVIQATGVRKCTECRQDVPLKSIERQQGELVVITECTQCKIIYTSRFRLRQVQLKAAG